MPSLAADAIEEAADVEGAAADGERLDVAARVSGSHARVPALRLAGPRGELGEQRVMPAASHAEAAGDEHAGALRREGVNVGPGGRRVRGERQHGFRVEVDARATAVA